MVQPVDATISLSAISCWGFRVENFPTMPTCSIPCGVEMSADPFGFLTVDGGDLNAAVIDIAGKKIGVFGTPRREGGSRGR